MGTGTTDLPTVAMLQDAGNASMGARTDLGILVTGTQRTAAER